MIAPSRILALCLIAALLAAIDAYVYYYPREFLAVNPMNLGAICSGLDLSSDEARKAEADIDTPAFMKAIKAAALQGAAVEVPQGCWVRGVTLTHGNEFVWEINRK